MKKLSETYKKLGIDFTFPIEIKDAKDNETYYESIHGYWRRQKYDTNGNVTYYENSDGRKKGTPRSQSRARARVCW